MQIDRTRFLALVAGIAAVAVPATACKRLRSELHEATADTESSATPAADPGTAPMAEGSAIGSAIPDASAGPRTRVAAFGSATAATPTATATVPAKPSPPADLEKCLFYGPPGAPQCEGVQLVVNACTQAKRRPLPPPAREKMLACLAALNGTKAACSDDNAVYKCANDALKMVPVAPEATEPCKQAVAACKGKVEQSSCEGAISLRPAQFRERGAFCFEKRCNTAYWCAFGDPDITFIPKN
jgi:hypothetical protein